MVWSVIDKTYQYPEHKDLSSRDIGTDLCIYTVDMYDMEVDIMIGLCDSETIPGINTYSIYVMHNKRYNRIGLFEISTAQSRTCLDDVGDVDVSRLGNPLLFRGAEKVIRDSMPIRSVGARKKSTSRGGGKSTTTSASVRPHTPSPFQIDSNRFKTKMKSIPIQTSELCQREKWPTKHGKSTTGTHRKTKKKNKRGRDDWLGYVLDSTCIQTISVTDRNGTKSQFDSLDCVLSALNSISQQPMDPDKVRISISEYIGEDSQPMVHMCESYHSIVAEMKRHMDILSDDNDKLRGTSATDMNDAKQLIERGGENKSAFIRLRRGVDVMDRFAVRTGVADFTPCDQYADLADDISSRTVPVNIPFLSMMEKYFQIRILCVVRDETTDIGYWFHGSPDSGTRHITPIICIAMDATTCCLMKYKGNTVFTHETLPWIVKCIIARNVPVVNDATHAHALAKFHPSSTQYVCSADVGDEIPGFGVGEYVDADTYVDATNDSIRENLLHVGETTVPNGMLSYVSLYSEKGWRAMLSDEWMCDITHDGYVWGSVAHYLAAIPFKAYPEYYTVFSKKSRSDVSTDARLISKHTKSFPKKIKKGTDATSKERISIYESKFTQHPTLKSVLKKTRDSVLLGFNEFTDCCAVPRTLVPNIELMRVRESIR